MRASDRIYISLVLKECSMDARKTMARSVFLAGGLTMLPGFPERLHAELQRLLPSTVVPKVIIILKPFASVWAPDEAGIGNTRYAYALMLPIPTFAGALWTCELNFGLFRKHGRRSIPKRLQILRIHQVPINTKKVYLLITGSCLPISVPRGVYRCLCPSQLTWSPRNAVDKGRMDSRWW